MDVIGGHILSLKVGSDQSQTCLVHSELYVGLDELGWMGFDWMVSQVLGSLRAPSVLIKLAKVKAGLIIAPSVNMFEFIWCKIF